MVHDLLQGLQRKSQDEKIALASFGKMKSKKGKFTNMNEIDEKQLNNAARSVANAVMIAPNGDLVMPDPAKKAKSGYKRRSREKSRGLRQAIVADARAGIGREQLAQKYGVESSYVYAVCKKVGIVLKKVRPIPLAECLAALRSDMRLADITAKLHVDYTKLKALVDEYQIDRRRARRQTKSWEVIELLSNTTLTMAQIGQKMGVTRQRVHQIYQRAILEGTKFPHRKNYRTAVKI